VGESTTFVVDFICRFSKSFQDVVEVQADIWNFQQYAVVREYYDRPPLFLPFSTVFDIVALTKMVFQWYLKVRYHYANPTQRVFSEMNDEEMIDHLTFVFIFRSDCCST
jgi:hypothetical protein